ncbi:MAG: hypothetical protein IPO72_11735 [Saprospiraceae bacterium]|nr:hypothetical protein [Candidatus Vicinibacter affinis]
MAGPVAVETLRFSGEKGPAHQGPYPVVSNWGPKSSLQGLSFMIRPEQSGPSWAF